MKKYYAPQMLVEKFDVNDVIMVSSVTTQPLTNSLTSVLDSDIVFKSANVGSSPVINSGAAFYLN